MSGLIFGPLLRTRDDDDHRSADKLMTTSGFTALKPILADSGVYSDLCATK